MTGRPPDAPRPRRALPPAPDDRESGQVAGIEILPFALLIFVAGMLLVANAWAVINAKMAASNAAAQTARTYAETPAGMGPAAAWARAAAAGDRAFAAAGVTPEHRSLRPRARPGPFRCSRVVVEAQVTVERIVVPWLGGFGDGLDVHATRSELVDPYRSGLEGGDCG